MERDKVYVWKSTGQAAFSGLALECQMFIKPEQGRHELWFDDTIRGHMFEGEIIHEDEDGFVFLSKLFEPGEWTFKLLTIENFKREYHSLVCEGDVMAERFQTSQELYGYYANEYDRYGYP